MRIGLFFGSFDPPHIGHYANITKALNRKSKGHVDKVIIIPAYQNPWKKKSFATYTERINMCTAIAHQINRVYGDKTVIVSDVEGSIKEEVKYTHLVLKALQKEYPKDKLIIICGTDVARDIPEWKEGKWITDNFGILNIDRGGYADSKELSVTVSSSMIRKMVEEQICPLPFITTITWFYIKKNHLYGSKLKY